MADFWAFRDKNQLYVILNLMTLTDYWYKFSEPVKIALWPVS